MQDVWVDYFGSAGSSDLTRAMSSAFEAARKGIGRISAEALAVDGFCGQKFRMTVNNLFSEIGNRSYLEIGVFCGATFFAAIDNNRMSALGVDGWSWGKEANALRKFYNGLLAFKHDQCRVSIIEGNFKNVNYSAVGSFDVLFYDGPHGERDQYNGIRYPFPALRDDCIILVDDWNWEGVRSGTKRAFGDLGVEVFYAIQPRTSQMPGTPDPFKDIPGGAGGHSDWHNGFFAAVVKKHGTESDLGFIQ